MTAVRRFLSAVAGLLIGLIGAAAAHAGPTPASRPVLASITLPEGGSAIAEIAAGSGVWTLSNGDNKAYLYRIDLATNQITAEIDLPSGSVTGDTFFQEGMVYGAGSLWVPETFRNEVLRIDPVAGQVIARIPTGSYPQYVTYGGGSLWVTLGQAAAVARIDPASNRVVANIPVGNQAHGTEQPFDATWDPYTGQVLVTLNPGNGKLAVIDGATQRVSTLDIAPAYGCGRAVPFSGGFWIDDTVCSAEWFRYDAGSGQITADVFPQAPDNVDYGMVIRGDVFYTGEGVCNGNGCHGVVVKRDLTTGAPLARVRTPNNIAVLPELAAGDLWVGGFGDSLLVRLRAF